ncbi:MAG: polyprenyltransferase, partial [Sphingobacteriales bacterium]
MKTISYLRLMRPANIVTSVADVLAGCAIAGVFSANEFPGELSHILTLCFATACL